VKSYVVLNDIQMPFQDKQVLDLVLGFIRNLAPDGVILNGDIVDCYTLSVFDKNPWHKAGLVEEIREAGWLMDMLRDIPERVWIDGNHEDRVRRMLWKRAPEFGQLAELEFPRLFHLEDYGFSYHPYGDGVRLGKLLVTHGTMVRSVSGASARAHFDRHGVSTLIGHTHRLGAYYRTNLDGPHAAYENGCLCLLTPEYVKSPDWQQGFSVVHVDEKTGLFNVQQIPILNRRQFFYGGEQIQIKGKR